MRQLRHIILLLCLTTVETYHPIALPDNLVSQGCHGSDSAS